MGLYDGFMAIFGSVYLLFWSAILVGVTILYVGLRPWLKRKTAAVPSPRFRRGRTILRLVPVLPTIAFFLFAYNNDYGSYTMRSRDYNPTALEHVMDALGNTLNLAFIFYAIFEFLLLALLWQARKAQQAQSA